MRCARPTSATRNRKGTRASTPAESSGCWRGPRASRSTWSIRMRSSGKSGDYRSAPRQEHLATLQNIRPSHRRAPAQAARPAARRGHGDARTAPPRGAGARPARPYARRHHADLRDHPPRPAQAGGVVQTLQQAAPCTTWQFFWGLSAEGVSGAWSEPSSWAVPRAQQRLPWLSRGIGPERLERTRTRVLSRYFPAPSIIFPYFSKMSPIAFII